MPSTGAQKSLGWILNASAEFLAKHSVESPRLSAEHLAARLLHCQRLDLQLKLQDMLPDKAVDAMRRGILRLASGEPVQYVLGQWDFRGLTLKTDRRALIPRPETEELVQLVLNSESAKTNPNPHILDYGTGTGSIAISIVRELPGAKMIAVDISEDALDLAKENALALGAADRITFCNLTRLDLSDILEPGSIDIVVSNPPYIPTASYERLARSVRDFEPREALDGGPDGMAVTRCIIEESAMLLASGGWIFLEISAEDRQAFKLREFLSEIGFDHISIHRDPRQTDRFVSARLAEGI